MRINAGLAGGIIFASEYCPDDDDDDDDRDSETTLQLDGGVSLLPTFTKVVRVITNMGKVDRNIIPVITKMMMVQLLLARVPVPIYRNLPSITYTTLHYPRSPNDPPRGCGAVVNDRGNIFYIGDCRVPAGLSGRLVPVTRVAQMGLSRCTTGTRYRQAG